MEEGYSPKICPKCKSKYTYVLKDGTLVCRKCAYRGSEKKRGSIIDIGMGKVVKDGEIKEGEVTSG